jgi:hypothetical protein
MFARVLGAVALASSALVMAVPAQASAVPAAHRGMVMSTKTAHEPCEIRCASVRGGYIPNCC